MIREAGPCQAAVHGGWGYAHQWEPTGLHRAAPQAEGKTVLYRQERCGGCGMLRMVSVAPSEGSNRPGTGDAS